MKSEYTQVTKEQFDLFIKNRFIATGVKLDRDVTGICEPPLLTLNDFSNGLMWPESIVAKGYLMDGSEYYDFKTTEYFIKNSEMYHLGLEK